MQTKLPIIGMTCNGCAASVLKALMRIDGVESVDVGLPGGITIVDHNPEVTFTALEAAVEAAGFEVKK